MCSNTAQDGQDQAHNNCVQLVDKVNNDSQPESSSDTTLEHNDAGVVVKKVVFKIGAQFLGEADILSESEEENLVMDFSENEEEKSFT